MKHVERMRVNWVDTEASSLIHYTAALRYFETAEHTLLRKLVDRSGFEEPFLLPRVHIEASHGAPLRYPDEFDYAARVAALDNTSDTFAYEVRRNHGAPCITGQIVAVTVSAAGESIPLPPQLREALAQAR